MKIKFLLLASAFLGVTACRTPLNIAKISPEKNISLSKDLPEDQHFKNVIEPYKQEVEGKMNTKISHTAVDLNKQATTAIWETFWQIILLKVLMTGRKKTESRPVLTPR